MPKGLYKMKMMFDTSKPKMDTLLKIKRAIGDTAVQMKKAEQLGLKSASDALKQRLEEKKKQMKSGKG